jgi:hypothetical protein
METEDLQNQKEEQEAVQASQRQEPDQGAGAGQVIGQEEPQGQEQEQPQPVQPDDAAGTQTAGDEADENVASEPEDTDQANGTDQAGQPQEKMIPQSEVNRILQARLAEVKAKAREEAIRELKEQTERDVRNGYYTKYGVDSDDELDGLFANGQKYGVLNSACGETQKELEFERAENALLRSGIKEDRFDDVRAWAQFNNQPITPETIQSGLQTHPEWLGTAPETVPAGGVQGLDRQSPQMSANYVQSQKPSVIQKVGSDPGSQADTELSEKQRAFAAMGIDYRK